MLWFAGDVKSGASISLFQLGCVSIRLDTTVPHSPAESRDPSVCVWGTLSSSLGPISVGAGNTILSLETPGQLGLAHAQAWSPAEEEHKEG